MNEEKYIVEYGCETSDGGSGYGIGRIVCDNRNDTIAVFELIREQPHRFDFPPDDAQKYVRYEIRDDDGLPVQGGTSYLT